MSPEKTVKLARHSILTALAMDTVGFAMNGLPDKAILQWVQGNKILFPVHKGNTALNGKGSYNNEFFYLTLATLADSNPVEHEHLAELVVDFKKAVDNKKQPFETSYYIDRWAEYRKEQLDNGLVLSVALATAYYSALVQLTLNFTFTLFDMLCGVLKFDRRIRAAGMALCFTIRRLFDTGWFGWASMHDLVELKVITNEFGYYLDDLMAHNLDAEYLGRRFTEPMCAGLIYSEKVILQSFYYMTRVDTAYTTLAGFNALPRDQIPEIMLGKVVLPHDLGLVFGALCTVSEPNLHPLVTKHLREGIWGVEKIDELLTFIS